MSMLEVIMFAFQDYDNTVQTIHVFKCVQYIIVYVLYIIHIYIIIYIHMHWLLADPLVFLVTCVG